ncbi:hypothetical protein [Wenzhouxiangella limi]|uniref:Uncharacterized protein n=1 Tax=Wenzhouxiangella limi TaxID=2707351 RepID=A0A845UQK7_9GAMM|nr:hypothetical protein [Wenzhouxiangella limi]NDY94123.1 hypothetical protein [Wenzhouxiangella limi]
MMKIVDKQFRIGQDRWYHVEIGDDYQVVLICTSVGLDAACFELDGCDRHETPTWAAVRLFREIQEYLKEYVYEHKPPYLLYTTGGDDSRNSLYSRLAKRFSRYGYHAVETGIPSYFLIMKDSSDN